MDAADRDGHPAYRKSNRITAEKDTAMADAHASAFVYAQRTQPLALVVGQNAPVNRGNFRVLAIGELIKQHVGVANRYQYQWCNARQLCG